MPNITTTGRIANSTTQTYAANGLHKIGDDWYQVAAHSSAAAMTVYKSADDGTTWTEQDTANRQAILSAPRPWDSCVQGTKIYVASVPSANAYTVDVFDTVTGLWTTSLGNPTAAASSLYNCRILARSDGDILFAFTSSADESDILVSIWNGTTWSSDNVGIDLTTAGAHYVVGAAMDRNNIATFFTRDISNSDLLYFSVDAADSISATQTLNATVSNAVVLWSTSQVFDNAGTDRYILPFVDSNNDLATYTIDLDGTAPHTVSAASVVKTGTVTMTAASIVALAGTPYLLWWDSEATELSQSTFSSSWAALTQMLDGSYLWGQAVVDGETLAYVYQSSTTLVFEWLIEPPSNGNPYARIRSQFELRPY